jgi:hypothetical protein
VLIDPIRHGRAAARLAERYFDASAVLSDLVQRVMG